jgi:hypothetical protein
LKEADGKVVDVSPQDVAALKTMVEEVPTRTTHTTDGERTGVFGLSAAMLPAHAMQASERSSMVVQHAVEELRKKRTFPTRKDFCRVINKDMLKLIGEGKTEEMAILMKYKDFIWEIECERGWKAADAYHWLVMDALLDGDWQLSGQCGWRCPMALDVIRSRYPVGSSGATNGTGSRGAYTPRAAPMGTKDCPHHGKCDHDKDGCLAIQEDPSKEFTRHPCYRS